MNNFLFRPFDRERINDVEPQGKGSYFINFVSVYYLSVYCSYHIVVRQHITEIPLFSFLMYYNL